MGTYWGSGNSLAWLRDEHRSGARNYEGMCAGAAADAAGFTDSGLNANQWAWSIDKNIRHYGFANQPGMIQFWEGGQYGHVGWTLRDHVLLCNTQSGSIGRMQMSYYANIGPTFWVNPDNNPAEVFRACSGVNPDRPKPTPAPSGPRWPLIPGMDDPRVTEVKRAFGLTGDSHYGAHLADRVAHFERNHPAFGPPNHRIGPREYAAILAR